MDESVKQAVGSALGQVPGGLFVLCAQYEDHRSGILSSWVQQVCFHPPMLSVAVAKGQPIMPLISESHQFGLCQIAENNRKMMRKFSHTSERDEDPFLGFELVPDTTLGLPLLKHTLGHFECCLVCHLDVEGDHDLFVGRIHNGACNRGKPYVHTRDSGFTY
jgi:flavin reductase (DIM6/NTAB) family NADH-FMN oxidoreductase RutF